MPMRNGKPNSYCFSAERLQANKKGPSATPETSRMLRPVLPQEHYKSSLLQHVAAPILADVDNPEKPLLSSTPCGQAPHLHTFSATIATSFSLKATMSLHALLPLPLLPWIRLWGSGLSWPLALDSAHEVPTGSNTGGSTQR